MSLLKSSPRKDVVFRGAPEPWSVGKRYILPSIDTQQTFFATCSVLQKPDVTFRPGHPVLRNSGYILVENDEILAEKH